MSAAATLTRTVYDSIDSTNEEARRRHAAGHGLPQWIAAHRQEKGRGRQGRDWSSPVGNLSATRLHLFQGTPPEAARLSFTVALAVAETVETMAPDVPVKLKWPNDVLLAGKKVCGILLESFGPSDDGKLAIAIGIGINLAHHPDPTAANWPPTSIAAETGEVPAFDTALELLARNLDTRLAATTDFASIRRDWLARAANLGKEIQVRLPNETLHGRFADLDAEGALVLEGAGGQRRIAAGDVYFPGGA